MTTDKAAETAASDKCPVEAVIYPDRYPCTYERGHAGVHSWCYPNLSPQAAEGVSA